MAQKGRRKEGPNRTRLVVVRGAKKISVALPNIQKGLGGGGGGWRGGALGLHVEPDFPFQLDGGGGKSVHLGAQKIWAVRSRFAHSISKGWWGF